MRSRVRCGVGLVLWSRKLKLATRRCIRNFPPRVSLSKPMCPDSWMLGRSGTTLRRPGGRLQYHASIHQIVKKSPAALQLSIQRLDRPQHTFLAMCVGWQTRLPDGLVNRMVSQLTASRLVTCSFLTPALCRAYLNRLFTILARPGRLVDSPGCFRGSTSTGSCCEMGSWTPWRTRPLPGEPGRLQRHVVFASVWSFERRLALPARVGHMLGKDGGFLLPLSQSSFPAACGMPARTLQPHLCG